MEKARAQHRRARTHTAACADIIDGLIFLVMSVVEAKEEKAVANGGVPVPLNVSEWLALRRGIVRDGRKVSRAFLSHCPSAYHPSPPVQKYRSSNVVS